MILFTYTSNSEEDTRRFGAELGHMLEPGTLVLLRGELGAGKTCLSGAVAKGAGVSPDTAVTSPTYTLMQEYRGRCPIYHFDLYRLSDPDELHELGFDEFLHGAGIALVEWPERYPELEDNALGLTLLLSGILGVKAHLLRR
ncbi:MAG: tRNA (adenosine(37)-N6)-threonylcarbamoyltransferase complex ATPase subunit type 1 TsaE [Geobacteraceae bacterium]|nr:tRNA (adenosine(37)-N6)-threonylcarbamoyltransferase complex ATPase subunit type 1 TsaE [Geobacteraceae bacterium]